MYVVAGFKHNSENSIFYKKFKTKRELLLFLDRNIDKVEYISLRIVG